MSAQPDTNDGNARLLVFVLSALTALPLFVTLYASGYFYIMATLALDRLIAVGSMVTTTGLALATISLALRLRNQRNDLIAPPSLVPAIAITVIGVVLALGAYMAPHA